MLSLHYKDKQEDVAKKIIYKIYILSHYDSMEYVIARQWQKVKHLLPATLGFDELEHSAPPHRCNDKRQLLSKIKWWTQWEFQFLICSLKEWQKNWNDINCCICAKKKKKVKLVLFRNEAKQHKQLHLRDSNHCFLNQVIKT